MATAGNGEQDQSVVEVDAPSEQQAGGDRDRQRVGGRPTGGHGQQRQSPCGDTCVVAVGRHSDPDGHRRQGHEGRRTTRQVLVAERPDRHEHRGRRAGPHHDAQRTRPPGPTEAEPVEPEEGQQCPGRVAGDRDVPRAAPSCRGCGRRTRGRASARCPRAGAGPGSPPCRSCDRPSPAPRRRSGSATRSMPLPRATPGARAAARAADGRPSGPRRRRPGRGRRRRRVDQLRWGSQIPRIGAVPARGCSCPGILGNQGGEPRQMEVGHPEGDDDDGADDTGPHQVGPVAAAPGRPAGLSGFPGAVAGRPASAASPAAYRSSRRVGQSGDPTTGPASKHL